MQDKPSLLLVEDDRLISLALQIRLRSEGYAVTVAERVEQALGHVQKVCPQLAVVDINLPDGNGLDLWLAIQALWPGESITCVIMTASKRAGLRDKAMASGAARFLEKPFQSDELIEALHPVNSDV